MINNIDEWFDEKNKIRNYIIDSTTHLFELYSSNIDMCLRNDNKEACWFWIKAIEKLINFIDGMTNE